MAIGLQVEIQPTVEPVLLADMKNYLKVDYVDDDDLISSFITAARELVEVFTARSLVNKGYVQTMDAFPYYTDTVMSQMAYPPSYYSLPRYSTTLWNYSQMIKLLVSPLVSVTRIIYLGTDAQYHTLNISATPWRPVTPYKTGTTVLDGNGNLQQAQNDGTSDSQPPNTVGTAVSGSQGSNVSWGTQIGDITIESSGLQWKNMGPAKTNELAPGGISSNTFFADSICEPPRLFPGPAGSFWPPVMYVPNAVEIHFIAGYGDAVSSGSPATLSPPPLIPSRCISAIKMLVANWYENRDAASPLNLKEIPWHIQALLWAVRVLDMQPTRG